jgi:dipeptidyl aminopeptidase/acylaminoacyl peptidase
MLTNVVARFTGFGLACIFFGMTGPVLAAPEASSPELFFRHPDVRAAELSPSGNFVAVLKRIQGGRYGIVVMPTADLASLKVVAFYSGVDVIQVHWVSEDRLVYTIGDLDNTGLFEGQSVIAVDKDGSHEETVILGGSRLTTGSLITTHGLPRSYVLMRAFDWKSDDVIVGARSFNHPDGSLRNIAPYRFNTRTGELIRLIDPGLPEGAKGWLFDQSGQPRVFVGGAKGRRSIYYRDVASNEWQEIGNFDATKREGFSPAFFGFDDTLYVSAGSPSGVTSLHRFLIKDKKVEKDAVVELEGFDYSGQAIMDPEARKLLGFNYQTDAWGTVWRDAKFKGFQKKIDESLPNTVNQISCTRCLASKALLVRAVSDREPTAYLLFDTATSLLTLIGSSKPELVGAQMGRREFATFKARDGLAIPVYLTLPPGKSKGPFPMVVFVHGGPWVRGASWEWSAEPQFLASRGYVVIEPQFRSSTGFGGALFEAGRKQWGLAMQDDLADAAKWAIEQGYADPKRVAIGGASYGGYATLMGLIKNPELYRCGFEWVGVTDISLMYSLSWNDASLEALEYGLPALVGDPDKDSAQLKATSPLENASQLTQPVLMAYGGLDRRVPIAQGVKFRNAVSASNKNVEWLEYPSEGHGWYIEADDIDFWKHVEHFLDVNLKQTP